MITHKSGKIAEMINGLEGQGLDPHYLGFFECFNCQQFYEAHDVLEELWLDCRGGPLDNFYKALIQLAGAFVHLQKDRLQASGKLFRLCRGYFSEYPRRHEALDLTSIDDLIQYWLKLLEAEKYEKNPFLTHDPPRLRLLKA